MPHGPRVHIPMLQHPRMNLIINFASTISCRYTSLQAHMKPLSSHATCQ